MEHQHRGCACGQVQFLPLFQCRQPERRHTGAEKFDRVRIESGDDAGAALCLRPADRGARHRLMAKVEPVKIAQRNHRAAQGVGHRITVIEPAHQAALPLTARRKVRNENAGCSPFAA